MERRIYGRGDRGPQRLPIDMAGNAFLEVEISGINWTNDAPERYNGSGVVGTDTEVVTEVHFGGLFEGFQQVVIGLNKQTAYRVLDVSDPARIVIDVQHP